MVKLMRFEWAIRNLLRREENFVVIDGLLSTLLGDSIRVERMLERKGVQEDEADRFNRVDVLAKNGRGEAVIIAVQNTRELDYFHWVFCGAAETVTEYVPGELSVEVKKVYFINIIYFDLGRGEDRVYRGYTEFRGVNKHDVLRLPRHHQQRFRHEVMGDLYPEYYLLRVDGFKEEAVTPLDEWLSFLGTSEIPGTATAAGLPEARECLRLDRINDQERKRYLAYMDAVQYQRSTIQTGMLEGREEGFAEGRAEGFAKGFAEARTKIAIARKLLSMGMSPDDVATLVELTKEEVIRLQEQ
ncbi:MAG: PD-(D/E)XK nuclease family transposase [Odoribacteraceae bacterium]|jgi:predicted transposase/invertase (TIGR01784 family)|nr:PD-(D/E)XK nuclease family transposase [Odoribacteraceae bacterium]